MIIPPPLTIVLKFCQWLAETSGSRALHESLVMYPLIESIHVWTLAIFVGLAAVLDARLLGWALARVPVSAVARRLLPWMAGGFLVMVLTGALLFYGIPVRTYQNIFFRLKVLLLALAGVNVWVFHGGVWRRLAEWDLDPITPRAARFTGGASLVLWAAIIVSGRMIAYNWFDCDKPPHSAFVNWAAGCEPAERKAVFRP